MVVDWWMLCYKHALVSGCRSKETNLIGGSSIKEIIWIYSFCLAKDYLCRFGGYFFYYLVSKSKENSNLDFFLTLK